MAEQKADHSSSFCFYEHDATVSPFTTLKNNI